MKRISLLFVIALLLVACGGSAPKKTQAEAKQADCVEVLYFHGKKRCVTCNAIEKLTQEVVDSLGNNKIRMRIIDISEKEYEATADKYEVTWSSLILDHNGKVENLTEMGFAYAKNRPEEFKKRLTESIIQMLK